MRRMHPTIFFEEESGRREEGGRGRSSRASTDDPSRTEQETLLPQDRHPGEKETAEHVEDQTTGKNKSRSIQIELTRRRTSSSSTGTRQAPAANHPKNSGEDTAKVARSSDEDSDSGSTFTEPLAPQSTATRMSTIEEFLEEPPALVLAGRETSASAAAASSAAASPASWSRRRRNGTHQQRTGMNMRSASDHSSNIRTEDVAQHDAPGTAAATATSTTTTGKMLNEVPEQQGSEEDLECPICMESIQKEAAAMRCANKHYCHAQCLCQWIQSCRRQRITPTCPICRADVQFHARNLKDYLDASRNDGGTSSSAGGDGAKGNTNAATSMDEEERGFFETIYNNLEQQENGDGWGGVSWENVEWGAGLLAWLGIGFFSGMSTHGGMIVPLASSTDNRIAQTVGFAAGVLTSLFLISRR